MNRPGAPVTPGVVMEHPKSLLAAFCLAAAAMIAGCGPLDYRQSGDASYYPVQYGVIEGIDYVQREGGTSGAGALIGAIAGGVIGHQIGGGTGKTVGTLGGPIGGGAGRSQPHLCSRVSVE